MHFILALLGFGSLQTYLTIDRPKCVRQWLNGDGRRSRSRSRNRDPRAGPPGARDDSLGAGGRRSREGSPARRDLLSGRDHLPQTSGPHPRWPSQSRDGGGRDRPYEASWREGLPHRRDNTCDLGPDRFRSEDRRPPARSHAHPADRGGDRAGGSGSGCYGGGFYRGGGGGGGGRYVSGRGGGGYERERGGSGAIYTVLADCALCHTTLPRVHSLAQPLCTDRGAETHSHQDYRA